MSMTYTLPISSADHFNHGHTHTYSHSRSHNRHRTNSRLGPPFPLPRIPSESLVHSYDSHNSHEHDHPFHASQTDGQNEKEHNHSSTHTKGLISAPKLEPYGRLPGKRKLPTMETIHSPTFAYPTKPRHFSKPTKLLLHSTENYSLLHGILEDKDSRRIFYFMLLNLSFMVVQSTYGFLTGSLGLISDSIHMFFDCIALFVGICAVVMSKWPASIKFPYGYGKIDTLAGLGNGIFLMLISIEIIYEAIERLFVGSDLSRTTELLVVSSIGLGVNLVGILAFEHGHHGHGHSHGHSHGGHVHDHKDDHSHHDHSSPDHNHSLTSASASPTKSKKGNSHGHHHHGGENMQGIYLHIMADALGSVAVVVSTLLVKWTGWTGFDPIASAMIAILIFASAVPLVVSTSQTLLLSLDSDIEYNLRDILGGVSAVKGVVAYTVPKFWLEDIAKKDSEHDHLHSHGHDHSHEHISHHGHHHHDSADDHKSSCLGDDPTVLGVIHVIASQQADLADVRERVVRYLKSKNMDIIVQVERENEGRCFCGGGLKTG